MKPISSIFVKILFWLFLNLIIVMTALAAFFTFQSQINLHAFFGQQGSNRMRTAGMLIAHDLSQTPERGWTDILARHASIHHVDFAIVLENGSHFSSSRQNIPKKVMGRFKEDLRRRPPKRPPPQHSIGKPQRPGGKLSLHPKEPHNKPFLMMRTQNPTQYWSGMRIPIFSDALPYPFPALLLAVSDSITGNGFFFDPLPWMVVAVVVILISVLLWIPMVQNITRPLARMTLATEQIAKGRFDYSIKEQRADEIGRLAKAINRMSQRLSAFVKGQKRFLGDVSHELGSPIARIQFGLGALEQRVNGKNCVRVKEVMEDVDFMSKLVNELLTFSRADMKSQTIQLKTIDLLPIVQTAVQREATSEANIAITIDPEIRVTASAELLTRAIANLVRNAVRYAGSTGPITIRAAKKQRQVEITVQDDGPGVQEDLLDQLFEPFFRPEMSRDRNSGGSGLGLAIVKTCIQTCQGEVSARNTQPKGFAVAITLNQ